MLKAEHIPGKINSIADALSRSDSRQKFQIIYGKFAARTEFTY
jgi:hypothetical protein